MGAGALRRDAMSYSSRVKPEISVAIYIYMYTYIYIFGLSVQLAES